MEVLTLVRIPMLLCVTLHIPTTRALQVVDLPSCAAPRTTWRFYRDHFLFLFFRSAENLHLFVQPLLLFLLYFHILCDGNVYPPFLYFNQTSFPDFLFTTRRLTTLTTRRLWVDDKRQIQKDEHWPRQKYITDTISVHILFLFSHQRERFFFCMLILLF